MGFLDGLGEALGKAAAQAQEMQGYKDEYARLSDRDLKREHEKLQGFWGDSKRRRALEAVLKERGYRINN